MLARLARSKTQDGLDLIEFAIRVMKGEEKEREVRITTDTKGRKKSITVDVPPSLEDRMDAMKWLADRGWGKAVESVEIKDDTAPVPGTIPAKELEEGLEPDGAMQ
jgi:hypothetical protein